MARLSVAGIRTFVEGCGSKAVHIGGDVHKRSYNVALLRSDGAQKAIVSVARELAVLLWRLNLSPAVA